MTTAPDNFLRLCIVTIMHGNSQIARFDESLRIVFSIRSDADSATQPSTIQIYNLTDATSSVISEVGDLVRVEGGYRSAGLSLIGEGQIRRVDKDRMANDRITTINMGSSADRQVAEAIFNQSYQNVPLKTVVNDMISAMGVDPHESVDMAVPDETLASFEAIGPARQWLQKLMEPRGIRWWVQSGLVYMARHGDPLPEAATTRIDTPPSAGTIAVSESTGMIETPSITEDGVKFRTLLNPQIQVDQDIRLESEIITGTYRTLIVAHNGDTRGEWVTEVEAQSL